ncbi:MAG TPA: hypothetical protein VFW65_34720 [Pseudonocardiaceae bacterium]|nr:hypothetical protein [Pseudonocardiaceae bacterium]
MTGQRILTQQFDGTTNPTLTLVVEIAWGADITAADTTWTWTDVTGDVHLDAGVTITMGRADEASTPQPANCKFTVDNTDGSYSLTPLGSNWPNVRRGTPIRVRTVLGSTSHTRFEGFAVGFTPSFNTPGTVATTAVEAAGVYRRLGQGDAVLQSVLRTSIPTITGLKAYWPMEDATLSTSFASAFPGGQAMQILSGTPEFANNKDFPSTVAMPTLKNASLYGRVNPAAASSTIRVNFLASFPETADAPPDGSSIIRVHTIGSLIRWDLLYGTGGSLALTGANFDGTPFELGPVAFDVDGKDLRVAFQMVQNGADIDCRIATLDLADESNTTSFADDTATGQTLTGCYAVAFAPAANMTNLAVGQCYVETSTTDIFSQANQVHAFAGEAASDRFGRLCDQVGVPHAVTGSPGTAMGPQNVDTFLKLVQECADANLGVIYDGLSAGLTFRGRDDVVNQAADMTIDATDGVIAPPFAPVDDDQLLTNQWTITQKNGSSAVAQDTDGPLGSDTVGLYDSSLTVNIDSDDSLPDLAGWKLHETTVQGYRYPAFTVAFEAAPSLLSTWLASSLLSRVDVTNAAAVVDQVPDEDVRMLVQGYTETITNDSWVAGMNTTPYDPWRVGVAAADTGDTGEFVLRADTDGATIHTAAAKGATTLSVSTPSGPLWTTVADDYPLFLDVAGIRVKATACSGASSPQTFTVDATTVTKALAVGDDVAVWQPMVLGL